MKLNSKIVCIEVEPDRVKDDSGVYLQDEWIQGRPVGTVVEVASDVTFCKTGDIVMFERYTSLKDPMNEDLRYCREDAVMVVYDAESN